MRMAQHVAAWARSGAPLPYDAEVEWLEANGGAYIDADVKFQGSIDYDVICDFEITDPNGFVGVFGFYWNDIRGGTNTSKMRAFYRGPSNQSAVQFSSPSGGSTSGNIYLPVASEFLTRNRIRFNSNTVFINGNPVISGAVRSDGIRNYNELNGRYSPFLIFCSSSTNDVSGSGFLLEQTDGSRRLYGISIADGGKDIRDFIPVRVGSVGYLYDRVSGQLFSNAGTGAFVIGPDKT